MDYITHQLHRRINYYETEGNYAQLQTCYRALIEYTLIFSLGFLWNRNFSSMASDRRDSLLRSSQKPTIGHVLEMCRTLDIGKELFGNKPLKTAFNNYPALRNERIGHGFVFEDFEQQTACDLKKLVDLIFQNGTLFISQQYDLILVDHSRDEVYRGINFKSNGLDYLPWSCPKSVKQLLPGCVYAFSIAERNYSLLSPFIHVTIDHEYYIFKELEDRLLGRVRYNQLLRTGTTTRDWRLPDWDVENDGSRRRTANGTVINTFTPNYKKYIHVGIKDQIDTFLLKNRASVCATVWGHGGVGKTATVQSLCSDLAGRDKKFFDYIIFVSAKDRYYDYYTGAITVVSDRVDSLDGIVRKVNGVMGHYESSDEAFILEFDGTLLLVIDDYETFSIEEKTRIESFIRSLDIRHHKVVITTRANLIIGEEIPTAELDEELTVNFLKEVLRTEVPSYNLSHADEELRKGSNSSRVHALTNGRPLFICQFAIIWGQEGSLVNALGTDIKGMPSSIEFLYGRIFSYLSEDAKKLFWTIGQLVTEEDLANLLEKLRYVSNYEDNLGRFEKAVEELKKLRIIEVSENDFFRVYSREILSLMQLYYDQAPQTFRSGIIGRIKQVTRDKKLDNEHALLENANSARYSRSEEEVISLYRQILNRSTSPKDIKVQALINLADWLFNARAKKELALRTFRDYEHLLGDESSVVRMFASYCWVLEYSQEAVQLLKEFLREKNGRLDRNMWYELSGLLLTYDGIAAINEKDQAKAQHFQDRSIDYSEYNARNEAVKIRFREIQSYGLKLMRSLEADDMRRLSPVARQNLLTGFYQLANVCIRITDYDNARTVCEFCTRYTSDYLHREFSEKLVYIAAKQELRW